MARARAGNGEQRFKRLGHMLIKAPLPLLLQKVRAGGPALFPSSRQHSECNPRGPLRWLRLFTCLSCWLPPAPLVLGLGVNVCSFPCAFAGMRLPVLPDSRSLCCCGTRGTTSYGTPPPGPPGGLATTPRGASPCTGTGTILRGSRHPRSAKLHRHRSRFGCGSEAPLSYLLEPPPHPPCRRPWRRSQCPGAANVRVRVRVVFPCELCVIPRWLFPSLGLLFRGLGLHRVLVDLREVRGIGLPERVRELELAPLPDHRIGDVLVGLSLLERLGLRRCLLERGPLGLVNSTDVGGRE